MDSGINQLFSAVRAKTGNRNHRACTATHCEGSSVSSVLQETQKVCIQGSSSAHEIVGVNMANTDFTPKLRVLLVEDDRDVASVVCLALEDFFDVSHAATAHGARLAIRSACPDLVLLDWHLGNDSGQAVLAELELIGSSSRPPVIITSGGEDETLLEAVRIGSACHLPKPFSIEELVRSVTRQLLRRRPSQGDLK